MPARTDAFVRTAPRANTPTVRPRVSSCASSPANRRCAAPGSSAPLWRTVRRRRVGLGSYPDVSLAKAREKAKEARRLIADGQDPSRKGEAHRRAAQLTVGRAIDLYFAGAARAYKMNSSGSASSSLTY